MAKTKRKVCEQAHAIKIANGMCRVHLDYKEVNDFKILGYVLSNLDNTDTSGNKAILRIPVADLNKTLVSHKSKTTRLSSWIDSLKRFINSNLVTIDDKDNCLYTMFVIFTEAHIPYIESNDPNEPKRIDLDGDIVLQFNKDRYDFMTNIKQSTQFYLEDIMPVVNKTTIQLYLYIRSMNKYKNFLNSVTLTEKELFELFGVDKNSYMNKRTWKRADGSTGYGETFNRSRFLARTLDVAVKEINDKCTLIENVHYEKIEGEEYQYRIHYENKHLLQFKLSSDKSKDKDLQYILSTIFENMKRHVFVNYATLREFRGSFTDELKKVSKLFHMETFEDFRPLITDSIINKTIDALAIRPLDLNAKYHDSTDLNRAIILCSQRLDEIEGIIDKPESLKDLSRNYSILASYIIKTYKEGYEKTPLPIEEDDYVNPFKVQEEDNNPFHQPDLFDGNEDELSVSDIYDEEE